MYSRINEAHFPEDIQLTESKPASSVYSSRHLVLILSSVFPSSYNRPLSSCHTIQAKEGSCCDLLLSYTTLYTTFTHYPPSWTITCSSSNSSLPRALINLNFSLVLYINSNNSSRNLLISKMFTSPSNLAKCGQETKVLFLVVRGLTKAE